MLLKTQITEWLNHPVTEEMLRLLQRHQKANKDDLMERMVYGSALNEESLQLLAQLKGQILAFDQLVNIKEFLIELVEEHPEDTKDEIQGIGS